MYLVICYDICDDKRRQRLHRCLRGYLTPVQLSVFEGQLAASRYEALRRAIVRCVDLSCDAVRIYQLGARRGALTEHLGAGLVLADQPEDILL